MFPGGDNIVKQTNEHCYLGVMITACGSFSSAMKMLYKKGLKAMFWGPTFLRDAFLGSFFFA